MRNLGPVKTIVYGIVLLVGIALLYKWFSPNTDKIEVTSDVVLEKMEVLGKLELTKLTTKDVLEKKILKPLWVDWFDEKILFIAVGEVAGCIDLTKVQEGDITITEETISIELPAPEICYAKLNHERSRIYDMKGDYLNLSTQKRIEEVYKLAESKIEGNAIELGIIEQTKTNAELIIKPLFETLSGKQVKLSYRE